MPQNIEKMKKSCLYLLILGAIAWTACENVDTNPKEDSRVNVRLDDLARLLAGAGIGEEQLGEVHDAVSSSSANGYDEEYTMRNLFRNPGYGVGDNPTKAYGKEYDRPLRVLLRESLEASATKSGIAAGPGAATVDGADVDSYLEALEKSDLQIYWPYYENWDGKSEPIISFAPDDDSEVNVGYRYDAASGQLEEVLVDEELAMERPVWVVNRNDDSSLTTLEMLRKEDPSWGEGGGEIIVKPKEAGSTKALSGHKMLVLKDFRMKKNFDSWFAGGSEFNVQVGSVDGFYASTEAELKLYQPSVTQFSIVIRRCKRDRPVDFNAVLISDWTEQIENCALLVTEDDGGEQTNWKCSIVGRIKSKSYGFEIDLPYRQKDDIVWRGQLSRAYIEANDGDAGHFGDIDLSFELVDY